MKERGRAAEQELKTKKMSKDRRRSLQGSVYIFRKGPGPRMKWKYRRNMTYSCPVSEYIINCKSKRRPWARKGGLKREKGVRCYEIYLD